MDKRKLQELLSQKYNQETWKKIVQFVFPNVEILAVPKIIHSENEKIKKFIQIGSVRLTDGKNLALFQLLLSENVNIQRNRVELNNEISEHIDQETYHGVLSVFEQGTDDYRFTFSSRNTEFDEEENDFLQKKTDTKRYTYVLGKNESCKTPADRFFKLSESKNDSDINAIQNAFSVEQLSKEFFEKYKKQFEKFWRYIATNEEFSSVFFGDEREKGIRDFVKKLLGRIVFLHFLQKKGWMGCTSGKLDWEDGDKQFMQSLFENYSIQSKFHSKCLVELFYNTLNKKRPNDSFIVEGLEGTINNSKVPYLNGGLFDSDEEISKKIDFPKEYFKDLFDFFSHYNFTIDENDPNDHEVGIDPEMLGHIFENLLEDNKDKGAFYTPKVIVQYMCQESIVEYINTKINVKGDNSVKNAIDDLIRNRLAEKCSDLDLVEPISKAIYEVKICDPAIGSGAFPMGILNVIYQAVEDLYFIQPDSVSSIWKISDVEWQPNLVKKNIIQHSIYGVDIESGAVDIARLRFWLALVVDETEPLPLPNLDYKIMQGNSLLESFEGIDLSDISLQSAYEEKIESNQYNLLTGDVVRSTKISMNFDDTKEIIEKYFSESDPILKKELHEKVDKQAFIHIKNSLKIEESKINRKKKVLLKKIEKDILISPSLAQYIRFESKEGIQLINLDNEIHKIKQLELKIIKLSKSNERPFFLWHLFFQEVFDIGGFDIVIGNPPYIGEKGNEKIFQKIENSNLGKNYYTRWMDYFYFFFHFGIDILKTNGTLNFITTNYYFTSTGGHLLRKDLKERTNILKLINFNEIKVFESAQGQHNVITFISKSKTKNRNVETVNVGLKGNATPTILNSILNNINSNTNYNNFSQDMLFEGDEAQIRIQGKGSIDNVSENIHDILQKMNVNSSPLGTITNIAMGIVSLSDTVSDNHIKKFNVEHKKGEGIYVLSNKEVDELKLNEEDLEKYIKPFYKNSQITRYICNPKNKSWLIYIKDNGVKIHLPVQLNTHFEKYKSIIIGLKDNFLKNKIAASVVKKWYANGNYFVLFTPKKESYFTGVKIVAPYRSKLNIFGYSEIPIFGSKDIAYILEGNPDFSLKYITCLLNSKLMYKWLYYKGKRKGDMLELYKKPLSEIPIKKASEKTQIIFEEKLNVINDYIQRKMSIENIIFDIDILVFKLYNLEYEEIFMVDDCFIGKISKEDYDNIKI